MRFRPATRACGLLPILAAVVIGTLPARSGSAELPDAKTAAAQVGETVEFQDVVKAVSYSRARKGRYLSFGAPYPDQVLSVWVNDETWAELPTVDGLLGRTVRIRGKIESASTGPLLKIDAPAQFELLPVSSTVLTDASGGQTTRAHFRAAVIQDFERGEFGKLEALATELQQKRARFSDGTWKLQAFFDAFDLPADISDERYDWTAQAFDRWLEAQPFSTHAIVLKAALQVDRAWKARGTGFASTVTKEAHQEFRRELSAARRYLEDRPQAKASPHYYVTMQSIALGEGWPKDDYFQLVQEGISREPDYYGIYFAAAHYLLPRWHGRKGEWEEWAEQQRGRRGGAEGDILYTRIVWSMERMFRGAKLFRQTAVSWEKMAAGFDALLRQYPDSAYLKNAYAHFCYRAGDRARLVPALAEILDAPDMSIWVNQENVEHAKSFAVSRSD